MADFYELLVAELRDDPLGVGYANMTDQQVAASLNEPRYSVPTQRFITWRAIAAVLDDDEYAAVKAALNQLAQVSPKVADMIPFLSQATGDDGTGGGIDFGNAGVRAMIQALPGIGEATKQKLLALGERPASRAEILGLPEVYPGHVESARSMI